MKNSKRLLMAALALLSMNAMAVQPGVMASEENPFRLNAALHGGMVGSPKFGVNDIGLGLGFEHNAGYDIQYGVSIGGSWAAFPYMGKDGGWTGLFTDEAKAADVSGIRANAEATVRFMPEVAEAFRVGLNLGIGWSRQFGDMSKKYYENMFGDLNVKVGPAMSYGFTDMMTLFLGVNYTLSQIRFIKDEHPGKDAMKEISNLSGIEIPIGLWFALGSNVGMFVEANTKFVDFGNFKEGFKEEVSLGLGFAL